MLYIYVDRLLEAYDFDYLSCPLESNIHAYLRDFIYYIIVGEAVYINEIFIFFSTNNNQKNYIQSIIHKFKKLMNLIYFF